MLRILDDPVDWPKTVRRLYVIFWPLASTLRLVFAIGAMIVCGIILAAIHTFNEGKKIWNGNASTK